MCQVREWLLKDQSRKVGWVMGHWKSYQYWCLDQVSVARNDWESWILTGLSLRFKLPVPLFCTKIITL